jgi:hypothetical protein
MRTCSASASNCAQYTRATANQRQFGHIGAGGTQRIEPIHHAEGHAFEHRIAECGALVFRCQPVEDAGGVGIVVRCALARQVGQEQRRIVARFLIKLFDLGQQALLID